MLFQCLSTTKLPDDIARAVLDASPVLDYCNMPLRLPRLPAHPPVINVADVDGANDVRVTEAGDGGGVTPMAVRDVFPISEDTRSSQISLVWKKGRRHNCMQWTVLVDFLPTLIF